MLREAKLSEVRVMPIEAQFINSPPSTITGPFEFSVEATNTGSMGDDFAFEAVLTNPNTGEQAARIWSTNVWMPAGSPKELVFTLAATRNLTVPDGQYELKVIYGSYPAPSNWKTAVSKTVQVSQSATSPPQDGGDNNDGGGQDNPPQGNGGLTNLQKGAIGGALIGTVAIFANQSGDK